MTLRAGAAALVVLVALAGCSSDSKPSGAAASSSSSPPAGGAAYAGSGPFPVGYTTLHLPDRDVAVWYPASPDAVAGQEKATYDQASLLPDDLKALTPPEFNTVVTMDAYADVRASDAGPFPVVLFAHGWSAHRLVNSRLTTGIASWGFVVVSTDYLERGIEAQIRGTTTLDPALDRATMLATLDLVTHEGARTDSLLSGIVDTSRVGAIGHSAGGQTAFGVLDDERIDTAIGYAPLAPTTLPTTKPIMLIGAGGDIIFTPDELAGVYATLPAPKRLVDIGGSRAGHNTFTDACDVIREGGGLLSYARANNLVPEDLLKLGENGCAPTDIEPARFDAVVQHFTVAELRYVFGIDKEPVGLGDDIVTAFGDIPVSYQHEP